MAEPLPAAEFHPLSSAIALEIAAATLCGRRCSHNSDHYMAMRLGRLQETLATSLAAADLPPRFEEYAYALLVADGLGEHGTGARASRVALSAIARLVIRYGRWTVRVDPNTHAMLTEQGEFLYRMVNDAVAQASHSVDPLDSMATSLTVLYVAEGDLFFWHLGHSRAFLFREGELTRLTADHTLETQLRSRSERSPLRPLPDARHRVTESVGRMSSPPEVEHVTLMSGDRLLLCTNGLTDAVSDEEIADTLALQRSPNDDCDHLIELARRAGTADDATVVLADYRTVPPAGTRLPAR